MFPFRIRYIALLAVVALLIGGNCVVCLFSVPTATAASPVVSHSVDCESVSTPQKSPVGYERFLVRASPAAAGVCLMGHDSDQIIRSATSISSVSNPSERSMTVSDRPQGGSARIISSPSRGRLARAPSFGASTPLSLTGSVFKRE
ncbi:hypothetical protein A3E39_01425 [Candidatus Uhrbacteria bacterium RIFCSPHIGHO2_12_FULL_60_25]|uniref:Uncharacterized protein n=1 Tax=Candidatus Uhrbacteria bacterium RIFCSPHIGHO2_12_FULL_60_25 TaxID=1802399 RepID=A0A1F7UM10_9BACT|nr:MAG: hypothetical protein A3D73_03445 [Candidatus Uhrbacteria bacterium RIFCSPHIGHO2_02_FULL_60_44]OGL78804.1 MAG: hypothetical protein A3E39_01425 [Candidatus Uhrbacteria bacterium RIFCSPHIGHO2_12_FULL_60_25]